MAFAVNMADGVHDPSRQLQTVAGWRRLLPCRAEYMEQVQIIGIDLAKQSFQLHGAREDKEGKTPWDYAKANAALKGDETLLAAE